MHAQGFGAASDGVQAHLGITLFTGSRIPAHYVWHGQRQPMLGQLAALNH